MTSLLGQGEILIADRIDEQFTEAVQVKYLLGHHQSAYQEGELDGNNGYYRQHGIFQCMPVDDEPFI